MTRNTHKARDGLPQNGFISIKGVQQKLKNTELVHKAVTVHSPSEMNFQNYQITTGSHRIKSGRTTIPYCDAQLLVLPEP